MATDPNNAKVVFMGRPVREPGPGGAPDRALNKLRKRGLVSDKQMRRATGMKKGAHHGKR